MVEYKLYSGSSSPDGHSVITYDDKKNPLHGLLPYHYYSDLFLFPPKPEQYNRNKDMDDGSYTTSYQYMYNEAGYPTEMIISEDGDTETWSLEYR